MGTKAARLLLRDEFKDSFKHMGPEAARKMIAELAEELGEKELGTAEKKWLEDVGRVKVRAALAHSLEAAAKKSGKGAKALLEDEVEAEAKGGILRAANVLGVHSIKDAAQYGIGLLFTWKFLAANQAQNVDECKRLCMKGQNTAQTPYATPKSTSPDPNCPSGQTDGQCDSYCSTTDPGACSRKNNLARGSAKCGGIGIFTCAGDAAGGAFDSFDNFWGLFGDKITYLGYGLVIFLMCVFVYYTAKTFMVTKVGNVVTKAKRAGESFGGKPQGGQGYGKGRSGKLKKLK